LPGSDSEGDGENQNEGDGEELSPAERERKRLENRMAVLREFAGLEREFKAEQMAGELERLKTARENELITEQEHKRAQQVLEMNHWAKMAGIRQSSMNSLTKMVARSYGDQAGAVASAMQDIVTSTATQSKRAFEISKKVAAANAVVKGWEAATSAWAAGMSTGGPWAPAVAASYTAASLAKTGAQLSAIQSQSFQGGGGTSAAASTGVPTTGGGTVPGTGTPGGASGGGGQSTIINLQGDSFGQKQVRELIEQINESSRNGSRVILA